MMRPSVEVAKDIRLSLTPGARAVAPQFLQWDKRLCAILPENREFAANFLNLSRSHVAP